MSNETLIKLTKAIAKREKEEKPVEKVETNNNCEGGVCILPFKPEKHLPPIEITNVKKPTPRKLWIMARQVELKAYLEKKGRIGSNAEIKTVPVLRG